MLNPIYYFKVNLLKPEVIFANYPDSNLDNIKNQLINSTIWVEGVPYPLKHGDVFKLSGMQALKVKELYIDSNQTPILDIVDIPNVENLTIGFTGEQVGLEWSSNNNFYTQIDIRFDEGNWNFAQKIEKGVDTILLAPLTETAILQVRLKFVDDQGNSSRSYIYESIEICSGHQCDVNDAPTDIALSASTIAENNTIGDVIGTLSTTDPDAGNSFTYSLVSGTGDTNNASFAIDGASLKANAVFNFEVKSSYTIRVRSTDQGGLTTEKAFTITVTDVNEAPTDIALSDSTIAENNEIGTVVGTLSTTDPDAGDTFTYTLASGTGDTDNASFTISGSDLIANEVFDFEVKSSYSVRIRSTDQGSLTTEKAFTITVTNANETPTNLTLSANTIAENNEIGAVIGTFTTTDPDAGNTFTYTLIETAGGSELDNASFSISGSDLIANVVFDYEVKSTYYIHVRSTDQGGLYGGDVPGSPPYPAIGWTFTITVTDVSENQAPTDISLSSETIAENNEIGAVVGTLSTTDPDAGDTFTYSLISGEGDADNASFAISGSDLISNEVFDYEAKSSYAVRIRSTDQGSLTTEKAFTITVTNVNETPTNLTLSANTIAENNEIGAVIGTFTTTDPDAENTFTYTLIETAGGSELDNASFSISGSDLIANVVFDYEVKSTYYIHVRSTDQGGLYGGDVPGSPPFPDIGWTFTITVTDVSENQAPTDISLSSETIAENNEIGAVVGTLSTTDPDAGDTFTYTLASGTGDTDNASFTIDGADLIANEVFDYEAKSSYAVRIRSTDQGSLTTERSFTITVTNVNEQPTYVTLSSDTIAENNEIGAVIGTFSTTDQDAGDTFTYTLTETINGTELDNASFSIDGANLIANVVFDYEVKSTYYIHVRSTDQDGLWTGLDTSLPPWPNDWGWRFTITVTDASENSAPTDITISSETIPLNNASGAVIGALSTTDPDAGDTFTYTLVSGEGSGDNFDFSIAGSNVIAQTANMSEMKGYWFIRVRSTDQGDLYYEKPIVLRIDGTPPL